MTGLGLFGVDQGKEYYVQTLKKGYIKPGLSYEAFKKWMSGDSNVYEVSESKFKTEYASYLQALSTGVVAAKHCGADGMTSIHFLILFFVLLIVVLLVRFVESKK